MKKKAATSSRFIQISSEDELLSDDDEDESSENKESSDSNDYVQVVMENDSDSDDEQEEDKVQVDDTIDYKHSGGNNIFLLHNFLLEDEGNSLNLLRKRPECGIVMGQLIDMKTFPSHVVVDMNQDGLEEWNDLFQGVEFEKVGRLLNFSVNYEKASVPIIELTVEKQDGNVVVCECLTPSQSYAKQFDQFYGVIHMCFALIHTTSKYAKASMEQVIRLVSWL